jgi:hypothetical protein
VLLRAAPTEAPPRPQSGGLGLGDMMETTSFNSILQQSVSSVRLDMLRGNIWIYCQNGTIFPD